MGYASYIDAEATFFAGTFRDCIQGAVDSSQFGFVRWNERSGVCEQFLATPPGTGAFASPDHDYATFQSVTFPVP